MYVCVCVFVCVRVYVYIYVGGRRYDPFSSSFFPSYMYIYGLCICIYVYVFLVLLYNMHIQALRSVEITPACMCTY